MFRKTSIVWQSLRLPHHQSPATVKFSQEMKILPRILCWFLLNSNQLFLAPKTIKKLLTQNPSMWCSTTCLWRKDNHPSLWWLSAWLIDSSPSMWRLSSISRSRGDLLTFSCKIFWCNFRTCDPTELQLNATPRKYKPPLMFFCTSRLHPNPRHCILM